MAGANIDLQNCRGDSALMTVSLLLRFFSSFFIFSNNMYNFFIQAARYNSTEVVAPIIFARANLDLVTCNGNNTALMIVSIFHTKGCI